MELFALLKATETLAISSSVQEDQENVQVARACVCACVCVCVCVLHCAGKESREWRCTRPRCHPDTDLFNTRIHIHREREIEHPAHTA